MSKSALICGATGQDGALLSQLLLQKGYKVFGLTRDRNHNTQNLSKLGILDGVELRQGSLLDREFAKTLISDVRVDEIYNLSGQSSVGISFAKPVETIVSHVLGTLNLLEAIRCSDFPAKLMNAGSGECFAETGVNGADESTPFRPGSPYAVAKASAFWEVSNYREVYGLFACTGILFNHESPLRPDYFVTRKIIRAVCSINAGSQEKLTLGDLSIRRDWGWAPEYVKAMWLMLQQESAEDYVISTGVSTSLEEFVAMAFECVGLDWGMYTVSDPNLFRPFDIRESIGDASKAKRNLGWEAKLRIKDVVQKMIDDELEMMA